jgi:hypothetical protein
VDPPLSALALRVYRDVNRGPNLAYKFLPPESFVTFRLNSLAQFKGGNIYLAHVARHTFGGISSDCGCGDSMFE